MKKEISIADIFKFSFQKSFNLKLWLFCFLFWCSFFGYLFFPPLIFLSFFFLYKLKRHALSIVEVSLPKEDLKLELINFFILSFKTIILNFLCWYDKKYLVPILVLIFFSVSLFILSFEFSNSNSLIVLLSTLLMGLSFIIYIIIFFIHYIKTSFAPYLFLVGLSPEQSAIRQSYEFIASKNLTKKIIFYLSPFLFLIFIILILFIISFVFSAFFPFLIFMHLFVLFILFVGVLIFEIFYAKLFKELINNYKR